MSTMPKSQGKKKLSKSSALNSFDNDMSPSKADKNLDDDMDDKTMDEDEDIVTKKDYESERKRKKLLEAISSIGGKKRKKMHERSEATIQMSEFSADGEGDKIHLSDLIHTVEQTPVVSNKTTKQLKKLQTNNTTLDCPLSKQQTERIQRETAFQRSSSKVSRWQSIIRQNQRAEQMSFPLNQDTPRPKAVEHMVIGWKAKTPLEQEVFQLLNINKQPTHDPVLTPIEESSSIGMKLEEAKIRRAELQKMRAIQSHLEAKAKRMKKIKSKKYHKVQNKVKRKNILKEFDEMVKKDPAAALKELDNMKLSRIRERMSLKHQNSGKWAKSKAVMAKYSDEARKAMQEQLEIHRNLTEKSAQPLSEDEEEDEEDVEVLPDFVNDAEPALDSLNPWMRGKLSTELVEQDAQPMISKDEDHITDKDIIPQKSETEDKSTCAAQEKSEPISVSSDDDAPLISEDEDHITDNDLVLCDVVTTTEEKKDEEERYSCNEELPVVNDNRDSVGEEYKDAPVAPETTDEPSAKTKVVKKKRKKRITEIREALAKKNNVMDVPLNPTSNEDTEESQMDIIKEAFAGDDVVADFLKDKKKQEELGKPKALDLTLPGWGEWGGVGIKVSRKKCKRFRRRPAPPPPRKDGNLPTVIISEKINSATVHQVGSLPFPFENRAQFESTIRCPVGHTWNTQQTVRKMTAPKITTQLGTIIEPMTSEELTKDD